jgi:hypothetical protein
MSQQLDAELQNIKSLKWLPWIGNEYFDVPYNNKLLIIGESHYGGTQEAIHKHEDILFTRIAVDEFAVNRQYYGKIKLYRNMHLALMGNDTFNTQSLWSKICFYNFIQKTMNTNKGRPTDLDFSKSWETFFPLVEVLQPKVCLFMGLEACKSFEMAISKYGWKSSGLKQDTKISRNYARTVTISNINQSVEIIFIKHPSQYFSWTAWNKYLYSKIEIQLEYLKKDM